MTVLVQESDARMSVVKRIAAGLLAIVAVATAIIIASGPSVSHDVYWHVATGDAYLERGVPFTQDDLGYTQPDQPLDRHSPVPLRLQDARRAPGRPHSLFPRC